MRKFRVVEWDKEADGELPLECKTCHAEVMCPTHGHAAVIATIGMAIVYDQDRPAPGEFTPLVIECPKCRTQYSVGG